MVQPLWKTFWQLFSILKLDLPHDQDTYHRENFLIYVEMYTWVFIAAFSTFFNSSELETIQMVFGEYNHITRYCSAITEKELLIQTRTWMNLKEIMLSAKSQCQKDTYFRFIHESTYVTFGKWHNYRYEEQINDYYELGIGLQLGRMWL